MLLLLAATTSLHLVEFAQELLFVIVVATGGGERDLVHRVLDVLDRVHRLVDLVDRGFETCFFFRKTVRNATDMTIVISVALNFQRKFDTLGDRVQFLQYGVGGHRLYDGFDGADRALEGNHVEREGHHVFQLVAHREGIREHLDPLASVANLLQVPFDNRVHVTVVLGCNASPLQTLNLAHHGVDDELILGLFLQKQKTVRCMTDTTIVVLVIRIIDR